MRVVLLETTAYLGLGGLFAKLEHQKYETHWYTEKITEIHKGSSHYNPVLTRKSPTFKSTPCHQSIKINQREYLFRPIFLKLVGPSYVGHISHNITCFWLPHSNSWSFLCNFIRLKNIDIYFIVLTEKRIWFF